MKIGKDAEFTDRARSAQIAGMYRQMKQENARDLWKTVRKPDYAPHYRLWLTNVDKQTNHMVCKAIMDEDDKATRKWNIENFMEASELDLPEAEATIGEITTIHDRDKHQFEARVEANKKRCL